MRGEPRRRIRGEAVRVGKFRCVTHCPPEQCEVGVGQWGCGVNVGRVWWARGWEGMGQVGVRGAWQVGGGAGGGVKWAVVWARVYVAGVVKYKARWHVI